MAAPAQPGGASADEVEGLRQELAALRETVARLEASTREAQTSLRAQAPARQRQPRKPKAE
jgi:hypothetical protein